MRRIVVTSVLAVALHASESRAAGGSIQAFLGGAYNLPTTLRVRQTGEDELRFQAHYRTRAFEFPLYYSLRVARASGAGAWQLDLTHHKLHLDDPPPQIESFEISHGYNLITLSRSWNAGEWAPSLGVGALIAHPESTVRGRRLDESGGMFGSGYHFSGPTLAAMLGRRFHRGRGPYTVLETRLTWSFARVPIAGGDADAPNFALHALAGIGYQP